MALDNPSYFSISNTSTKSSSINEESSNRLISVDRPSRRIKSDSHPVNEITYADVSSNDHYLIPNNSKSPRNDSTRRSFRSLLRSFSANASNNHQDGQSILAGEPRPADIAPADHASVFSSRPHRRFIHSRNQSDVRHIGRKKSNEFSDNDDVFYTMPLSNSGRRRHSFGAYFARDRISTKNLLKVTSVPSEVPKVDAPKATSDGTPVCSPTSPMKFTKKPHPVTTLHCDDLSVAVNNVTLSLPQRRKRTRATSTREMENIVIVSSKDSPEAELWVEYLISCFDKMMSERARQHYKIISSYIEELTEKTEDNPKMKELSKAKLQLLILCPRLLKFIEELSTDLLNLFVVFQVDKVLAMLLGVDDDAINETHRKAFPSLDRWQRMVTKDQNSTFIDNFLGMAVDILSKKYRNTAENSSFSIIPKKIKLGQNRVIALLNDPLTNQDVITVHVEKKGEVIQIKSFKKRNPYTLQFDIPDCCLEVSMLIWIKIEKNGVSCGSRQIKCESKLRELDQILRGSDNPLEFMCQTLGFKTTDREQLDSWMLSSFQKNIPPHFSLLTSPLHPGNKIGSTSVDEYPTLLHFAARFGLERLCWQLLECPGGETACDIRNVRHLTPADLAQSHGFPEISKLLRGFMQMSEFSNMYYYLKNMSEEPSNASDKEMTSSFYGKSGSVSKTPLTTPVSPDTSRSDPFSEECLHRLELKQVDKKTLKQPIVPPELLYQNDINHKPFVNDNNVQKAIEHDYLIQPSNRKVETVNERIMINRPNEINLSKTLSDSIPKEIHNNVGAIENRSHSNFMNKSNSNNTIFSLASSQESHPVVTPTGQDELAEIIKDFKNNVFTISEVEKLVMDWRNRNETQQSLKEKQEQLDKMREEYDKLQRRIKENMKRPTPFERVKKLFSKGKTKGGKTNTETNSNPQRPNSGLSVHSVSSSSSGRLSTASGVSIGESVTHFDNEDIKMFTRITGSQDCEKQSITNSESDNYLIPPPPRPLCGNVFQDGKIIHQPGVTFLKHDYKSQHHMDTINEREASSFQGQQCETKNYSNVVPRHHFQVTNNAADHNYINMSPA